ncbi:unnamed protein product [Thlaspi arvense]|uniref:Uncharacterized protein n=1 Tax=Thlaspi arvense TaxID=13288 RepID=A0AAU9S5U5_THLAR|nr:unnamed protein product [Thlaspi arvense]
MVEHLNNQLNKEKAALEKTQHTRDKIETAKIMLVAARKMKEMARAAEGLQSLRLRLSPM